MTAFLETIQVTEAIAKEDGTNMWLFEGIQKKLAIKNKHSKWKNKKNNFCLFYQIKHFNK